MSFAILHEVSQVFIPFRKSLLIASLLVSVSLPALAAAPAAAPAQNKPAATANDNTDKPTDSAETYRLLKLFGDVFERARAQYVEPVKDDELIESALNGMLSHLDPHSGYLNKDEFRDMQVQTRGEFGGLGIEVTMENSVIKVITPIDDTPASKAGLQAGDLIIALDGTPVTGYSLQEAVNKMRGPVGTKIRLSVVRAQGEPFDVTVTRAVIRVESVKWRVEGNVGYVRISSFSDRTQDGLDRAMADIKKQLGDKLEGWVLDLRNNPGGLLDQAVSVSDTFLTQGEIVSTRARAADDNQRYNATPGDQADGKPVVVLINNGSASASEIVAGALQDHKRAIILGVKSFGKGSVQTIIPLSGQGAMRLTTARYYTPSGRSIQAEGIVPDITVEQAKVETIAQRGLTFREADLRGALNNDHPQPNGQPAATTPAIIIQQTPSTTPAPDAAATPADPNKPTVTEEKPADYQLTRALDLIHGLSLYMSPKPAAVTTPEVGSSKE